MIARRTHRRAPGSTMCAGRDALSVSAPMVGIRTLPRGSIPFELHDVLVHCIHPIDREGEEGILYLVGRRDPIADPQDGRLAGRGGSGTPGFVHRFLWLLGVTFFGLC